MEKITIFPENKKQRNKLKAFLEQSKIYFKIENQKPTYDFEWSLEFQSRNNRHLQSSINQARSELKKIFDEHDMKINNRTEKHTN